MIKINSYKLEDGRNINVFRDDLLKGGTKIRLLNKIIPKIKNKIIVYASPATGYAQLALSIIGKKYNKKVVIFVAKNKNKSNPTLKAEEEGAIIKEIEPPAYLNVVQKRAKDYAENNNAYYFKFGLDTEDNVNLLSNELKKAMPNNIKPKNIWLVAGSGMILKSLYKIFPSSHFNVVQVGKELSPEIKKLKNITIYKSKLDFKKDTKIIPPYPSVPNYDAKVWEFVLKYADNNDYVFNIAGEENNELKGGSFTPPFPYMVITKEERDKAFETLKNYKCEKHLTLTTAGNKVSNYYFQTYRAKTKIGKWSHWTAWKDPEQRKKIIEVDKQIHRNTPNIIGTPTGLRSALRMRIGSINQFKPYIAKCAVYERLKPKRILDISAGWGDRLIAAMAMNINYIGIDQNKKLKTPYNRMIKDFKNKTTSEIKMIFEKSQDVDYSKLEPYDLIFTSPPYFDLEKYEGMEIYKTKEDFLKYYWKPTIMKSYKYLQKGGAMALNMPEEMYNAIKNIVGKSNYKIKMPIQNRFNWKGDKPKFEYIYVWKK